MLAGGSSVILNFPPVLRSEKTIEAQAVKNLKRSVFPFAFRLRIRALPVTLETKRTFLIHLIRDVR